jgi:L-threonylcarbamoyladenylate synthase
VRADLGEDVDVLLDGGECGIGLESTIVDLTGAAPVLLRPGGITAEQIESLLGVTLSRKPESDVRAPGMLASHYAPKAEVQLVPARELAARAGSLLASGRRVAVLIASVEERRALVDIAGLISLELGSSDASAAHELYAALRQADAVGADVVLAVPPASAGLGEALADRLRKAAGPRRSQK